ncbi:MAG TPA: DUF5977 domain-containing protein [Puia sp.]|nr:DUF5977 domain-containing protein [Puia sp.]
MMQKSKKWLILICCIFIYYYNAQSQSYPAPMVDLSSISGSPNASGFETSGNTSFSLSTGLPSVNIPVYEIKCGSLSLPISLSYYYSGLQPLQDASWVGLGWNLNVGGIITRSVQGQVDSSNNGGYNYGQFPIYYDLFQQSAQNTQNFLQSSYYTNTSTGTMFYDLAPDIFECNFGEGSFKFYWYNSRAYMFPYTKGMQISKPSANANFTIISPNGTTYIFGAQEITTTYYDASDIMNQYPSTWDLTTIISADKKDTISLSYASYNWRQYQTPIDYTFICNTSGGQSGYMVASNYLRSPRIQAQVIQSITCRTTQINFVPSTTLRVDINGSYPSLQEIDVIDPITNNLIKKNIFSYGYFGQITSDPAPATYERLKLSQFKTFNVANSTDSQTYKFAYVNDNGPSTIRISKGSLGIDNWGYYNGHDENPGLVNPPLTCYYINGQPPPEPNRNPDTTASLTGTIGGTYIGSGALDTIYFPTKGFTTFHYRNNYYQDQGSHTRLAPGLCVDTVKNFISGSMSPISQTVYNYGFGYLSMPNSQNEPFSNGTYGYTVYNAYTLASGRSILGGYFFYPSVTETISSGNEVHRTDYGFSSTGSLFADVVMGGKTEYLYNPANSSFSPLSYIHYSYSSVTDTSFLTAVPYMSSSTVMNGVTTNMYAFTYSYQNTYWRYLSSQQSTQYDVNGNSISSTINYAYNSQRNMVSSTQIFADGRSVIQKYKYPESYASSVTGNMSSKNILSPVIEKQSWIQYGSNSPNFISGEITQFDQTIFKPVSTYSFETTSPVASLNNETTSNGLYTALLSDSRYILKGQLQYDANNNLSTINKASDISTSYVWDYHHSFPVAEVKNAAQADIAYTSFENDGKGNWSFTGTATPYPLAPTGNYAYNLSQTNGNITKPGLTTTTSYIVSYWIKSTSPLSITGTTIGYPIQGKTINGWTYYEHKITGQSSVTISGTNNIDELRLYPANAQMVSFTYLPLIGKSSQCDVDNRITYYDYDGYGRLQDVKDQDGNYVKQLCYNYSGQPSNCSLTTYYSAQASGTFTKSCTNPYVGTQVTYTVPANTYTSFISQAAANQMAVNDVNANGQNNANANGSCVLTDPTISCTNMVNYAGFVAKYTNTSTNAVYSFTISSSGGVLGTIPLGTYNVTITIAPGMMGRMICSLNCNNLSGSSTTSVTFSNVSISSSACNVLTINAQ